MGSGVVVVVGAAVVGSSVGGKVVGRTVATAEEGAGATGVTAQAMVAAAHRASNITSKKRFENFILTPDWVNGKP
jgi:hypothetical protein